MSGAVFKNDFYKVTTPAAELPVTLAEFKSFAKIPYSTEDAFLTAALTAATDAVERYTNRWFVERTAEGFFVTDLCSKYEANTYVEVQKAPLQSVSSVEIWDGTAFAATTNFKLKQREGYSRILFTEPLTLTDEDEPYQIKVTFIAGYGDASAVPDAIKQAIMATANHLNDNRGDCECEDGSIAVRMPSVARLFANPYVIRATFG